VRRVPSCSPLEPKRRPSTEEVAAVSRRYGSGSRLGGATVEIDRTEGDQGFRHSNGTEIPQSAPSMRLKGDSTKTLEGKPRTRRAVPGRRELEVVNPRVWPSTFAARYGSGNDVVTPSRRALDHRDVVDEGDPSGHEKRAKRSSPSQIVRSLGGSADRSRGLGLPRSLPHAREKLHGVGRPDGAPSGLGRVPDRGGAPVNDETVGTRRGRAGASSKRPFRRRSLKMRHPGVGPRRSTPHPSPRTPSGPGLDERTTAPGRRCARIFRDAGAIMMAQDVPQTQRVTRGWKSALLSECSLRTRGKSSELFALSCVGAGSTSGSGSFRFLPYR